MARSDPKLRTAIRHNRLLFENLTFAVRGMGKKVLGSAAGAALKTAMSTGNTVHDSSRAAANWDLQIGGANPYGRSESQLAPKKYGDPTYGIGERGWSGLMAGDVIMNKLGKYGCNPQTGEMAEGGWVWNQLKIGQKGVVSVKLFNPVTKYTEYGNNAIVGLSQLRTDVAGNAKAIAKIAAFKAVKEINKQLKFPATYRP